MFVNALKLQVLKRLSQTIIIGVVCCFQFHINAMDMFPNFQNLSKAELHLHLGGAYPKQYLFSLATEEEREALENKLERIAEGIDYHEIFHVFQMITDLVNTEEKVQNGVKALCLDLQEDHVTYVEIRTGLKDLGRGFEAYLQAILAGIEATTSGNFQAKILLSLRRHSSLATAKETVDLALKYQNQGVIGIDISGDSTLGQVETIMPELLRAKQAGLDFVIHLGESPKEIQQLQTLEKLQPKRIGHGVYLENAAKEWIKTKKVPIEICLTSSVLVKMINHYQEHPGIALFHEGHPIVFCTDDPLLFSTNQTKELERAYQFTGLSLGELETIIQKSFEYSLIEEPILPKDT